VMTRPFWSDDKDELVLFVAGVHHLLDQASCLFTIHRHAAAIVKEPADWRAKYLRFAHEADICSQSEDHTKEENEVPVGGVWRPDQHKF